MTDLSRSVTVTSSATPERAQAAVDSLAAQDFPVQHLAIVWRGLKLVNDVTGRRDLMRSVIDRAWAGAFIGLVFGLLLTFFAELEEDVAPWTVILSWTGSGILAGAILGFVVHTISRNRQNFTTVGRFEADGYDVVCDLEHADRARGLLRSAGIQVVDRPRPADAPAAGADAGGDDPDAG